MSYWINIVLQFFIFGFAGWCMEVILKYRQYHRFINRGFLTGPILPIYGFGVILITLVVGRLTSVESGVMTTFAISLVICGLVEYLTSFVLEKIFHARWWDYSQKPMNLHGRVWIGNLVLFGLAGVAIIHIVNPVLFPALARIPLNTRKVTAVVLLAIFAADLVISCFVLKLVKAGIDSSEADNTEEISKEVRQLLTNRSYFYSRFADAYPEVVYKTERVQARIAAVKAEAERLQQEAERRLDERKGKIAARLEPASMIRADLIGKQDALISMLYDEKTANDDMKQLKAEIDRQKDRLDHHTLARHPLGKH
jgi:uncharacterized membrane protein